MGQMGGARPGAGRKKGGKNKATISAAEEKAINREVIREHIRQHIPELIRAQIENAVGVNYLVIRDKNGSYVEATNQGQVKAALAAGGEAFRVYTRQPNSASASMLLAYAADKPVEPVEVSGQDGGAIVVRWKE